MTYKEKIIDRIKILKVYERLEKPEEKGHTTAIINNMKWALSEYEKEEFNDCSGCDFNKNYGWRI